MIIEIFWSLLEFVGYVYRPVEIKPYLDHLMNTSIENCICSPKLHLWYFNIVSGIEVFTQNKQHFLIIMQILEYRKETIF